MYISQSDFLKYLDQYVAHFKITPEFRNNVKFAKYDEGMKKWKVEAAVEDGGVRGYVGRFLVVATGENCDAFVPEVDGLSEFKGEVMHWSEYEKKVLVVGAGNSGMEIAFDLANHGAKTSIVRSPVHILSRWSTNFGLVLLRLMPLHLVDSLLVLVSKVTYGDLTKYGIQRPKEGPFLIKIRDAKYPVMDVGTVEKIKSGEIQGGDCLLNKDGYPKQMYPHHWKGESGLYLLGLQEEAYIHLGRMPKTLPITFSS